jgi:hypothetical protein
MMKRLYSAALILNFLVELMAATTLVLGPGGIRSPGLGDQWSMHYGFAALAIASLSLWAWRYRGDGRVVTVVLGLLMTFHIGLFISLLVAGDQQMGLLLHGVLAILVVGLFVFRKRWIDQ